jgi:hypothetical protein
MQEFEFGSRDDSLTEEVWFDWLLPSVSRGDPCKMA